MKTNYKILGQKELKLLRRYFKVLVFPHEFSLVYENQIPNMGIVLLNGAIELRKHSDVQETVTSPSILGVSLLLAQKSLKQECVVLGQSEVILLSKSDIRDFQKGHEEIARIFGL